MINITKSCSVCFSDSSPLMKTPLHPALTPSAHSAPTCCLHRRARSEAAGETTQSNVLSYSEVMIPYFLDFTIAQLCNVPQQGTWTTCSQPHPEL